MNKYSSMIQDNLRLLEHKHPVLSFKLRGVTPSIEGVWKRCSPPLHQGGGVLVIYRCQSLSSLEEIEKWLAVEQRKVVLIEETPSDMLYFLSLKEAHFLLKHPAFSCHLIEGLYEELFLKIAWESLFLPRYFLTAFGEKESFQKLRKQMEYYFDITFLIASEYRDHGIKVAQNFYRNTSLIPQSTKARDLKLRGIPALICGAGPSIASQLEMCRNVGNRMVVFAGGALLSLCAQKGINPHLGALVDPDPPYARFRNCDLFEMPLLYQMRVSHQILQLMHGPKILSASSGESALEDYFFTALGELLPVVESGWNVANFMATCAAEMGCDPIVFIGMDMCYEPHQEYLPGVEELEQKGVQIVTTRSGKTAFSRKDLLMGNLFFSNLVERYPHQTFINATANGLPMEGMLHEGLEEVIQRCSREYDLQGLIHAHRIEYENIRGTLKTLKEIEETLKKSCDTTLKILSAMLVKLEKSYLDQKEHPNKTYEGVGLALEEIDLEEEPVYKVFLQPLWHIWQWVFFRHEVGWERTLEGKMRQVLFFQRVTREHQALFH